MRKHTLTILSFNQKESSTGVAVTGSESGHEGGGLRKGNQNSRSSRRLQTEPCLLLLKLTLMKDGSESEEVDCYDPSTEQFVRISGSSQLLKGFHDGVITSGRSTLMQEGAYFDDVEGSLIFPDLANVQYVDEEPEARRKLVVPVNPELEDFGGTPPASLLPLQLCEGDCDDDNNCAGGLKSNVMGLQPSLDAPVVAHLVMIIASGRERRTRGMLLFSGLNDIPFQKENSVNFSRLD